MSLKPIMSWALNLYLADMWLVNRTGVTSHLDQFNQEMQTIMDSPVFPAVGRHVPFQP